MFLFENIKRINNKTNKTAITIAEKIGKFIILDIPPNTIANPIKVVQRQELHFPYDNE